MTGALNDSPVLRDRVFILSDGTFVVQWDENRVQELLTGHYRNFAPADFGHEITDYELSQLKAAGRVEQYDQQHVWLYALPEPGRFQVEDYNDPMKNRVRSFYLNTTLPEGRLPDVQAALLRLGLAGEFLARSRGGLVAILGRDGAPFHHLKDAERAQRLLMVRASDIFRHMAIAFVETTHTTNSYKQQTERATGSVDSEAATASQNDISLTSGKRALLVIATAEEGDAIYRLLSEMEMDVILAETALEGLQLLEDYNPDLLVMDMKLPDMHGWEMLAKIKEIGTFKKLPIVLLADYQSTSDDHAFALTVGKVDVFLTRPISMTQLRQNVWGALKHASDAEG